MKKDEKVWLTKRTFGYNTGLSSDKFKDEHNHWDFAMIEKYCEGTGITNIILTTEIATGKTFGFLVYYLMKVKDNVAVITNTSGQSEIQCEAMLKALKYESYSAKQLSEMKDYEREIKDYFEGWKVENNSYWIDSTGTRRALFASISGFATIKGARDFYPKAVMYDEFNQNLGMAEKRVNGGNKTRAKDKLNIITGRYIGTGHLDYVYYFGNKNVPGAPLLATSIMVDLGITSQKQLGEVAKIYYYGKEKDVIEQSLKEAKLSEEKELNIRNKTLMINPQYTIEQQKQTIAMWLIELGVNDNKWKMDYLFTGDGNSSLFNNDNLDYDELIINTYRFPRPKNETYEYTKKDLFQGTWCVLACNDGSFLVCYIWNEKNTHHILHIYREDDVDNLPDDFEILCLNKPYLDNQKVISIDDKILLFRYYQQGKISYEDVASKVNFTMELI